MAIRSTKKNNSDRKKFRELILFIAERSEGDTTFGATKLNKLLFFSDFLAYRKFGKAITGQPYQKLEWGPAPRNLLPVLQEMQANGEIAESSRNYFGKSQKRTVALRDADLSLFTADEISLITEIIENCRDKNASDVSGISHLFIGWQAASDRDDIPYETILLTKPEPSAQAAQTGRRLEALAQECKAKHGNSRHS